VRFVIFGTGAVGGYVGARLSQGGHLVRFLARPEWVDALRGRGLQLITDTSSTVIPVLQASTDLAEIIDQVEVVLLCVKAYDAQASAAELARLVPHAVPVVSLLNGVSGEEILVQALDLHRVLEASLTTAVQVLEPGVIRLERERGLGLGSNHPMAEALAAAFEACGIRTRLYRSARAMKWSKLLTNMAGNVSSAILGWTAAKVMKHPGVFHLDVEALRETVRVMRGYGWWPLSLPGVPVHLLGPALFLPTPWLRPALGRIVSRGRGAKLPSLHGDIGRGRSEVYWMNGAVVEHGRRVGVPTPTNAVLMEIFDGLVQGGTSPETFRDRPGLLLDRAARGGVPGAARYNRPR
jgi:2-dehydropantoate 2-reductase